jgi:hypothetical protein
MAARGRVREGAPGDRGEALVGGEQGRLHGEAGALGETDDLERASSGEHAHGGPHLEPCLGVERAQHRFAVHARQTSLHDVRRRTGTSRLVADQGPVAQARTGSQGEPPRHPGSDRRDPRHRRDPLRDARCDQARLDVAPSLDGEHEHRSRLTLERAGDPAEQRAPHGGEEQHEREQQPHGCGQQAEPKGAAADLRERDRHLVASVLVASVRLLASVPRAVNPTARMLRGRGEETWRRTYARPRGLRSGAVAVPGGRWRI